MGYFVSFLQHPLETFSWEFFSGEFLIMILQNMTLLFSSLHVFYSQNLTYLMVALSGSFPLHLQYTRMH